MDPREALLNINFDQFGFAGRGISRSQARAPLRSAKGGIGGSVS